MPITRTNMTDDDGSGTTGTILNNAWKQELYNQIDALGVGLPITYGTWTPTDLSGAGLVFNVSSAKYARLGNVVFVTAHLQYPSTGTTQQAKIGGLPVVNGPGYGGFYHTYGLATAYQLPAAQSFIYLMHPTTMAQHTNNVLSTATLIFAGLYFTA